MIIIQRKHVNNIFNLYIIIITIIIIIIIINIKGASHIKWATVCYGHSKKLVLRGQYNLTTSTNQISWPDAGEILHHQYGISVAESQTFLLAKHSEQRGTRRNGRSMGSFPKKAARNLARASNDKKLYQNYI